MQHTRHLLPVVALTLLLNGCGGGDPFDAFEGDPGTAGTNGKSTLLAVSAEPPGGHCATGGSKIDAGQDANANGLLDANEVSSTQYTCGGANAGAAASTLVQMADEPSGANCAAGGKAINVGIDSNANGMLEASEVSSSGYVCNGSGGSNGANGTNGTNGLNTLMSIVVEPVGANCAYGGNKTSSGLDANLDSVLDAAEVSATSFVCNGAPGATLSWVNVTGAAIQAQPNTGYVASNDAAQVVVTLPANPSIGDVVRVSGASLGGWKIAQNEGQAVFTKGLGGMAGANWTASGPSGSWRSVAGSTDGTKLVAVANGAVIFTSSDGGQNWVTNPGPNAAPAASWRSVASSGDGSKLVAVATDGRIYTSGDSGASWEQRSGSDLPPAARWISVASSADGSKLVAAEIDGQIYTSADAGATWTRRGAPGLPSTAFWFAVASSADGGALVAVTDSNQIYISSDSGEHWAPSSLPNGAHVGDGVAIASSADGGKLALAAEGGMIYTSGDQGVSWTPRNPTALWRSIASSADGNKLVATSFGAIYTSSDSGADWMPTGGPMAAPLADWTSVASSADGSRLVAVVDGGPIFTSVASTTQGVDGSIGGGASDAIELRYVGNGTFTVLSHEGNLSIQ